MFTPLSSIKKLFSEKKPKEVAVETVVNDTAEKTATDASFQVERDAILVNQAAESRDQVLALIAGIMLEKGYVKTDYTEALTAREKAVTTYLANGVAIPHGVNEAKALVQRTGIVIVQVPEGVKWTDKGDVVHLAVGIAAAGNEHMEVLQKLSTVVMGEELAKHLGTQASADEIAAAIGQPLPASASETATKDFDAKAECIVVDESGLHARPASALVQFCKEYSGTDVWISRGTRSASADSLTELLGLGAVKGDDLTVYASGSQASEAVNHIAGAIRAGLDEESGENDTSQYQQLEELAELEQPEGRRLLKGIPASPGIAMARAFILDAPKSHCISQSAGSVAEEQALFATASREAVVQLQALQNNIAQASPTEAAIFQAQAELLQDTAILKEVTRRIDQGDSAAWAWHQTIDEQATQLEANPVERIQARAADMRDVGNRVLNILQGEVSELVWPDEPFVLVAKELTPSQTAQLNEKPVKAICTELGGATSHMAILARALGIPALVGIGAELLKTAEENEMLAVAPQSGQLVMTPDARTIRQVEACLDQWQAIQDREQASKHEPAVTLDGTEIEVVCNIASARDAEKVLPNGGAGVGLLRTEFLFESADEEPTVEEQVRELTEIVRPLGSSTLIVRTSDIGGDKPVSWLRQPKEENPFLGVRGIRLSLKHPEIFKRQLQAIYQVAKDQQAELGETGIHIMFPMISSLAEWRQARAIAEEVRQSLAAPEVPLGMMIEVPSAALLAEHFAKEVDFFSVGTNDLTQYTLAMDRMNPELSNPMDNYNPALLKMIAMTTQAASKEGKWVGVCGNLVAEPDLAKLLIGLGVKELSVSPVNVPAVKQLVRSVDSKELQAIVDRALQVGTPDEVKAIIREQYH